MSLFLYLFVIIYIIIWPVAILRGRRPKQGGSGLDDRRSQHGQE
jgi:hypothetical protein